MARANTKRRGARRSGEGAWGEREMKSGEEGGEEGRCEPASLFGESDRGRAAIMGGSRDGGGEDGVGM